MKEEIFALIKREFSFYESNFSEDGKSVEIINPVGNDNIKVDYYLYSDDFAEYTVRFAFQHCHMSDEEDILEYIKEIIEGKIFSIEYFKNGERRFGGEITAEKLKDLSYEMLEQKTGYYGATKLKDCADSFKVRGWHKSDNFDAVFVMDESGSVTIKIIE